MIRLFLFLSFFSLAFAVIAMKSVLFARLDERIVVFRLGKLLGVYEPGINVIIPFLDRVIRVKVERISGWRELSEGELRKKAEQIALSINV